MKINKRNIATIILAVFCAIVLAIGVSFVMPKSNIKSANAATNTPTITFGTPQYYGSNNYWDNISDTSLTNTIPSYISYDLTATGVSSTFTNGTGTDFYMNSVFAVPVIISIDVPAYTIYSVSYVSSFSNTGPNGREHGLAGGWSLGALGGFTLYGANFQSGTPQQDINGQHWNSVNGTYANGYTFTIYNNTSSLKRMEYYTYYVAHVGDHTNVYSFNYNFDTMDVQVTHIAPPTTNTVTTTYDGNSKTFNFTYDEPQVTDPISNNLINYATAYKNIVPTVSSAKYADGTDISSSTYEIENLDNNGIPTSANGTFKATEAGTYTLKFSLSADAIANGIEWSTGGTADKTLTFEIKRKPVAVPTVLNATQNYKAGEYEFGLSGYDSDIMSVPSGGYTSNNGSTITWDNTAGAEKFKATDAATYTVKFQLTDTKNFAWNTDSGESSSDQSKTITINKKEISITTTPAANTSPSWGLGETASIAVTASSGITAANYVPDFVLNMYYIKDGDTANPLTTGIDSSAMTLDVSQIESSGEYKLCIELTSAPANKNYSIANDKFEMPFTIGAGAIDTSVINWQYKEGTGNAADLFDASGVQEVLRYKKDGNDTVKYYILANINTTGSYLSIDNSYSSNGYTNGLMTTNSAGATVQYADKVGTYTTRVVLNTDSDHVFEDANKLDTDGLKGWYEVTWTISKGQVDQDYLDNLNENLQYRVAGGAWQTYDPANPPAYGSGTIEIRFNPAKYPDGVTAAEITVNDKNTAIGTYTAQVKFTVDTNNYETITTQSFQWRIGAKQIEVDWTSENWTDASGDNVLDDYGVPYQIKVLNIDDDLKQYIDYQYYIANSDLSMGSYVGTNEVGLEALTSAPYNANSVNPIYVYVKAVIKSGVDQYELKDDSGDDCALLFRLGATNTLVTVTQNATEMVYGESGFNSTILTLIASDTNSALGTNFIEGIYVYDSQGNELGLLSAFDSATAKAGTYTLKIVLTEAGNDTYTLTPGSKFTFTVKPKAIPVPTLSEIVFKNDFVDLREYLGGSWNEYQSIIKLGGTYDGVKNVGTYSVTLTLTDENYCWDYGTSTGGSASPGKTTVKYSLTDNVVWSGDETVANYDWKITPYVLKASGWNLSGKEGAAYNIPANLTDGLDVAINYLYHTDKTSNPLGDGESLEVGKTYFVKAQLLGADANNFVFEDSKTTTSEFATYKIPQSGAAAFMNSVKEFMTKTWLGLPVWAWFLIGLALLILLIIIIVVAVKRRKSKEEREEIKARKEEEKARREEERQMQREKLEAERELAKAKQEAELEKIRMQAQMSAGAGMASMAMQQPQQPQQAQPVQQPQLQQIPVPQYTTDGAVLAEIRAELAEIKARQNMSQSYSQPPMQMPMQMPMPMPMAMPQYMPMPQQQGGGNGGYEDARLLLAEERARTAESRLADERARAAEEKSYRSMEERAMLAEERFVRGNGMSVPQLPAQTMPVNQVAPVIGNNPEFIGAVIASALRNSGVAPAAITSASTNAEPQQIEEKSVATAPAVYPSDAVITTTTTVDTTKGKPVMRQREQDTNFDVDGFYDKYE